MRSGRYRTVTAAELHVLREAAITLLQAGNELGEVDGPPDADHAVCEDPVILRFPVGAPEPPQCWKPEVIRNAGHSPVPGALSFRLAQLLGDGRQRQEEERGAQQAIDLHDQPTFRPWKPRLGRSSWRFSIDFA